MGSHGYIFFAGKSVLRINYYFNSNKAWSSDKNQEKLKQFQFQEEKRQQFIAQLKKKWE